MLLNTYTYMSAVCCVLCVYECVLSLPFWLCMHSCWSIRSCTNRNTYICVSIHKNLLAVLLASAISLHSATSLLLRTRSAIWQCMLRSVLYLRYAAAVDAVFVVCAFFLFFFFLFSTFLGFVTYISTPFFSSLKTCSSKLLQMVALPWFISNFWKIIQIEYGMVRTPNTSERRNRNRSRNRKNSRERKNHHWMVGLLLGMFRTIHSCCDACFTLCNFRTIDNALNGRFVRNSHQIRYAACTIQ